jgi:uridine kinase
VTHSQIPSKATRVYGADVILFEGIFAFYTKELRDVCDLKIFTEEDDDIRLLRRLRRDVKERGRQVPGVIDQYLRFVKPAYDNYIVPMMKYADIVFPRAGRNDAAIDLITKYVNKRLRASGLDIKSLSAGSEDDDMLCKSKSVFLLPQRPQLLGMHTILRNRSTHRADFIFTGERLSHGRPVMGN